MNCFTAPCKFCGETVERVQYREVGYTCFVCKQKRRLARDRRVANEKKAACWKNPLMKPGALVAYLEKIEPQIRALELKANT